jgi:hypothetical protein
MQLRHSLQLLAAAGIVSASPAANQVRTLAFDDVVLLGADGTSSVVKERDYQSLVARGLIQLAAEERSVGEQPAAAPEARGTPGQRRRGCEESTEIQITSDTTFVNWDVALSPVVSAAGGGVTVSVESGYEISNTLSVGTSAEAGLEGVFSTTLSVDYSESWTSSQSSNLVYDVPDGQFGLVVSQPSTRRVQGTVLSGCTDSPTSQAFTSDSYSSQQFGSLSWVQGVIRLCNSTTYPVPYCIGTGTHS